MNGAHMCVCVCACVSACVRACVRACVCARVYVFVNTYVCLHILRNVNVYYVSVCRTEPYTGARRTGLCSNLWGQLINSCTHLPAEVNLHDDLLETVFASLHHLLPNLGLTVCTRRQCCSRTIHLSAASSAPLPKPQPEARRVPPPMLEAARRNGRHERYP